MPTTGAAVRSSPTSASATGGSSSTGSRRRSAACGPRCSTGPARSPPRCLPPVDDAHHGAAFAIAHDANFPIALIYWWQDENELHARIFAGAEIDALEPAPETALGCVWELGIVEFERRAWIADVIGNPDGPDLAAYLGRRFDGMI